MISAGEFRNGVTFEMDGQVFQIIEFQHVKPGKGSAFVRTKYRNVKTGGVVERSFNPSEKFERAQLDRADMTYLYRDGDLHYFMNVDTYEQIPFSSELLGDTLKFLKENMVCKVLSYKGEIFGIEPPIFVELEITDCEPGVKGDTATNVTKNAIVETGAMVKVPLFINQGERIRIDTRTGEYMERA
ncbi:MAG: elongation factor P [Clostridiaceae bacterium]|jgi:elongation factor P|nr:elongation factor P [Clostridiaceae bacterium]